MDDEMRMTTDEVEARLRDGMYKISQAAAEIRAAAGYYEKGKQLPLSEDEQMYYTAIFIFENATELLLSDVRRLWKEYCKGHGFPTGGDT